MSTLIAVDLGGTHLRAATAPRGWQPGDPLTVTRQPAPATLEDFRGILVDLTAGAADARLGIAIPGLVQDNRCRWVPNLPYLDGIDPANLLDLPLSVTLGNDAHLALLAERTWGGAVDIDDALLLALGTGIGSAVLAAGRIVQGAGGAACSFGWFGTTSTTPGTAAAGALELRSSGRALDRAGSRLTPPGDGPALVAAARAGDADALAALAEAATGLGEAMCAAISLLAPQRILLSGGPSQALDLMLPELRTALRRGLPVHLRETDIRAATHQQDAPLLGAMIAARLGAAWWTGESP